MDSSRGTKGAILACANLSLHTRGEYLSKTILKRLPGLPRLKRSTIGLLLALGCNLVFLLGKPVRADAPVFWLAPPDNRADFQDFFDRPGLWSRTARMTDTFSLNVPYLLSNDPETLKRRLQTLTSLGIKINVSIPSLQADKKICGYDVEGMIWPGELQLMATKLKALGIEPESFSLDLPLTSGHISNAKHACHFSIRETAERLALEIHGLRKLYPNAKLIDSEVPTGMPPERWATILREWTDTFKQASGESFYGVALDVWWKSPWQDSALNSTNMLKSKGIRPGIFLDASAGRELTAPEWISEAKVNGCKVRGAGLNFQYIIVSNWLNMKVPSLPETNPESLTALLDWAAAGMSCE